MSTGLRLGGTVLALAVVFQFAQPQPNNAFAQSSTYTLIKTVRDLGQPTGGVCPAFVQPGNVHTIAANPGDCLAIYVSITNNYSSGVTSLKLQDNLASAGLVGVVNSCTPTAPPACTVTSGGFTFDSSFIGGYNLGAGVTGAEGFRAQVPCNAPEESLVNQVTASSPPSANVVASDATTLTENPPAGSSDVATVNVSGSPGISCGPPSNPGPLSLV
jgi:hypothetical protein